MRITDKKLREEYIEGKEIELENARFISLIIKILLLPYILFMIYFYLKFSIPILLVSRIMAEAIVRLLA